MKIKKILVGSFIACVFMVMAACSTEFSTDDDAEDAVDDKADMTTDAVDDDAVGEDGQDVTGEDVEEEEIVVPPDCGDGVVDDDEECDDGQNGDDEDGCTDACRYTCHNVAECSDDEPCNGVEQCTGEHKCEDGDPEEDGYMVDEGPPRIICLDEESHESECGDGFVDSGAGEFCDPPGEDGCDDDCTYACDGDEDCPDDENPCNGEEYCNMDVMKCEQQNPLGEGDKCGDDPRRICRGGNCQESTCGDLYLDHEVEECDDGKNGDPDDGCTDECEFSCHGDGDCDDGNFCTGVETCADPSDAGRVCEDGEWPGTGTECNDGLWCTSDDQCSEDGECVGPTDTCNDPYECTTDECDEDGHACSNEVDEGSCLIGDVCRFHDDDNPDNDCEYCDTFANRTGWTNKGSGEECTQDASFCNGVEICNGEGGCIHPGNPCDESEVCWEDEERCCTVSDYLGCDEVSGDLYWYDSCDRRGERQQDCHDNPPTQNGYCDVGPPPFCACRTHWSGDFCHICPGNWNPAADCNACVGNFDIATDCEDCLPGWYGNNCDKCRRYVDWEVSGGDGKSWETAYADIQSALSDYCDEVWVREGTYIVTSQLDLRRDYALYGGFRGGETDLNDRNWRGNETIISGNGTAPHVFWCVGSMGCNAGTRIDGFTITGGYDETGAGSGMYCSSAAPTVENCIFEYNLAQMGGALFTNSCDMLVKNTIFRHNTATFNGGAAGVRGSDGDSGRTVFENCLFYDNTAGYQGGAIYNFFYSDPLLMNCTLADNIANTEGGASSGYGGAIRNAVDSAFCRITNSIVYYNIEYSIITGTYINSQLDQAVVNTFNITYSDIMGSNCDGMGCGTGSVGLVPLFFNRLISNYHILNASPCIDIGTDTGAPQYDLDGVLRYDMAGIGTAGVVTDMGCYEAL